MEDVQNKEGSKKPCARCRKFLSIDDFHKDSATVDGHKYVCKACAKSDGQVRYKKRKAETIKKGVCIRYGCANMVHQKSRLCPEHFYMGVATNTLKDKCCWEDLEALAKKQDYICPLTGDKLKAGVNMSLDHIKPVSRFPELKTKITNLQWITKWANNAKMNYDLEDFVANCFKVTKTWGRRD